MTDNIITEKHGNIRLKEDETTTATRNSIQLIELFDHFRKTTNT
jgi:hypothetical protein